MAIPNNRYVESQERLSRALQEMTSMEQGDIPVMIQTPAERRKSAAEARRVERLMEGSITRRSRAERSMKKILPRGEY